MSGITLSTTKKAITVESSPTPSCLAGEWLRRRGVSFIDMDSSASWVTARIYTTRERARELKRMITDRRGQDVVYGACDKYKRMHSMGGALSKLSIFDASQSGFENTGRSLCPDNDNDDGPPAE